MWQSRVLVVCREILVRLPVIAIDYWFFDGRGHQVVWLLSCDWWRAGVWVDGCDGRASLVMKRRSVETNAPRTNAHNSKNSVHFTVVSHKLINFDLAHHARFDGDVNLNMKLTYMYYGHRRCLSVCLSICLSISPRAPLLPTYCTVVSPHLLYLFFLDSLSPVSGQPTKRKMPMMLYMYL